MIISRNILEFINPEIKKINNSKLASIFIALGLEIDAQYYKYNKDNLENLVFGRIEKMTKVEHSNKLTLCEVSIWDYKNKSFSNQTNQIICGGDNLIEGRMVIVALPKQRLPVGFVIEKKKILGIESNGMICSLDELGISNSQLHSENGIFLFNESSSLFQLLLKGIVKKPIDILNDYLFDVSLVLNSHQFINQFVLANLIEWFFDNKMLRTKEIKLKTNFGTNLKQFQLNGKIVNNQFLIGKELRNKAIGNLIKIKTSNLDACYNQLGIKLISSLINVGFSLVNKVVNFTNLISYIFGQPMHIYDGTILDNKKVIVTLAKKEEELRGFFDKTIKITPNDVIIQLEDRTPISIPSIIGLKDYQAFGNDEYSYIEVLAISPIIISDTISRLNIDSISSRMAKKYSSQEWMQLASSFCSKEFIIKEKSRKININQKWIKANLGLVNFEKLYHLLETLGIKIIKDHHLLKIHVPLFFHWIKNQSDFLNFAYQLSAYFKLKTEITTKKYSIPNKFEQNENNKLTNLLQSLGYSEVKPYLLANEKDHHVLNFNLLNKNKNNARIKVLKPLNKDYNIIASSLTKTLLSIVERNHNFKEKEVNIFAIEIFPENLKNFSKRLAIMSMLNSSQGFREEFTKLTTLIYNIIKTFSDDELEIISIKSEKFSHSNLNSSVNFNNTMVILNQKKPIAIYGEINPIVTQNLKIQNRLLFGEINLSHLTKSKENRNLFRRLSNFPKLYKDVTFSFKNKQINIDKVKRLLLSIDEIIEVKVISLYDNNDSLSVSFQLSIYQEKNINPKQLNEILRRVIHVITQNIENASLKGSIV